MDSSNGFLRKRNVSLSGLGLGADRANKKPHFGMDFSALPTHLPGTSGAFASTAPAPYSKLPGLASLPAKPTFRNESKDEITTKNGPLVEPYLGQSLNGNSLLEPAQDIVTQTEKPEPTPEKEPVFIEGTNISLQTEEDIAKWIAERRKKWPTRKNVESKLQDHQTKAPDKEIVKETEPSTNSAPSKQNVCKFYSKTGRCKFGNKCRNVHEPRHTPGTNGSSNNTNSCAGSGTRKNINGVLVNIPQRYKKEVNGAGSLFTKLVQRDLYEHENNIVVDFIQYLDSKGLINHDISAS